MTDCGLDEGAQPHRIRGQFRYNAVDGVGHLHVQGNEVEPINFFPVIETPVDFVGVLVERFGEKTLLLGRAQYVLLEELIFVHDTDFF